MKIIDIGENDSDLFNREIENGPAFVKFYMPGCIHCENLKPTWIDLVDDMKSNSSDLSIIDVHSNALNGINSNIRNNVIGFPTIMMIYNGGKSFKIYEGDRSLEDMKKFINDFLSENVSMSGGKRRIRNNKIKSKRYKSRSKSKNKRKHSKRKHSKRKHSKRKHSKRRHNKRKSFKKY